MKDELLKALEFLKHDLKMEEDAADLYGRQADEVKEGWLKKILLKNKADEELHVEEFKYAIERIEYSAIHPRLSTGIDELDDILYGGIPKEYSVLLSSPPWDEKDLLIERFVNTSIDRDETLLYISTKPRMNILQLTVKHPENLYLLSCGSDILPDEPNIFVLEDVEDLTQFNITLEKILKEIKLKDKGLQRIFLDIIPDVLLNHSTATVRRWLRELLTRFKAIHGTILSALDTGMHSEEENRLVIDLFDGHLSLEEKKVDSKELKVLRVKRLYGMKYLERDLEIKKDL